MDLLSIFIIVVASKSTFSTGVKILTLPWCCSFFEGVMSNCGLSYYFFLGGETLFLIMLLLYSVRDFVYIVLNVYH